MHVAPSTPFLPAHERSGIGVFRNMASKVMWVGRTASVVFGLALVMAFVIGAASTAWSATGGNFILGKANAATTPTSLVGTLADVAKSAFVVQNKSGGTALDLRVGNATTPANNVAPMKVNSKARVANLNAASAGRADSAASADLATNAQTAANAGNADKLDGKDSSAFAIKTDQSIAFASDCDNPEQWTLCAPVTVTVPAGKTYNVSVWSSFTAKALVNAQSVAFCSGGRGPSISADNPCITPLGAHSRVTFGSGQFGAAATSGEAGPLSEGEYTFGTALRPQYEGFMPDDHARVITKVMVRNTANSF